MYSPSKSHRRARYVCLAHTQRGGEEGSPVPGPMERNFFSHRPTAGLEFADDVISIEMLCPRIEFGHQGSL